MVAAALCGCSREARDVGPTPPQTPPVGDRDPRISDYKTNFSQIAQGGRYFGWYGCQACHTETARGVLNLADGAWRHGAGFAHVYDAIASRHGRLAYGARVPSEQLWQLTAFVLDLPEHKPGKRRRVQLDQKGEPVGNTWGGAAMKRSVIAATLLLAGCSGVQSPLAPVGDQASALHGLLLLMTIVCGAVYVMVLGGLGWSLVRARRHAGGQSADRALDRGLGAAAALIVIGLTVLIVGSFLADRALFAARGKEALQVRVTAHQWWWRIEYRDPATRRWIETANELHLPAGRTARMTLASGDVIHSFWVPNVAGKLDMIPGRRNVLDLTPRREGWFRGQCAEFCGTQHAHMAFDVKVDSPAAFDRWLAGQARPASPPAAPATVRGAAVFAGPCGACHRIRGTSAEGRAGPDLTHVASRRSIAAGTLSMTRGNLQGWIAQPQALKPGTAMPAVPLVPADADAVAAYLETLH